MLQGPAPAPLVKDKFKSERGKAKVLNFSIAYGKTVAGLAGDFGVSKAEAKAIVDAWFRDRPEVLQWKKQQLAYARETGLTRTLMGRHRPLKGLSVDACVYFLMWVSYFHVFFYAFLYKPAHPSM